MLAGAVAVDVLDRSLVSPGDLVDGYIEDLSNSFTFRGAGSPAAHHNGQDTALLELALCGEFGERDFLLFAEVSDGGAHWGLLARSVAGREDWIALALRNSLLAHIVGSGYFSDPSYVPN